MVFMMLFLLLIMLLLMLLLLLFVVVVLVLIMVNFWWRNGDLKWEVVFHWALQFTKMAITLSWLGIC